MACRFQEDLLSDWRPWIRHACCQSKQLGTVGRTATFDDSSALASAAQSLQCHSLLQQPDTWPRQSHQRANDIKCGFSRRLTVFVVDCLPHRPDWFYRLSHCILDSDFSAQRCSMFSIDYLVTSVGYSMLWLLLICWPLCRWLARRWCVYFINFACN